MAGIDVLRQIDPGAAIAREAVSGANQAPQGNLITSLLGGPRIASGIGELARFAGAGYAAGRSGDPMDAIRYRAALEEQDERRRQLALQRALEQEFPDGVDANNDAEMRRYLSIVSQIAGPQAIMPMLQAAQSNRISREQMAQDQRQFEAEYLQDVYQFDQDRLAEQTAMTNEANLLSKTIDPSALNSIQRGWESAGGANATFVQGFVENAFTAYKRWLEGGAQGKGKGQNPQLYNVLVTSLAKVLDPRGVVRQSDYDVIDQRAGNILDRLKNEIAKLEEGNVTPKVMENLMEAVFAVGESTAGAMLKGFSGARSSLSTLQPKASDETLDTAMLIIGNPQGSLDAIAEMREDIRELQKGGNIDDEAIDTELVRAAFRSKGGD